MALYMIILLVKLKFPRFWGVNPKLIYAQALLETGNLTSKIYKENNNAFGLKLAKVRKTTAVGENRGHAVYKTLYDCVVDYFLRQQNFNIDTSSSAKYIISTVQSGYAGSVNYGVDWWKIYNKQRKVQTLSMLLIGILLLV